jgi:DNA polymerase
MVDDRFKLREMHLDVETRSDVDLKKYGPYRYVEGKHTDVWCACYAFGDGPVQDWVPGQPCPPAIVEHVRAKGWIVAHNAQFERLIWTHILHPRYGWPLPDHDRWICTMARAYAMALPGSLEGAAQAVGIEKGKDLSGHKLMLRMAKPLKSKLLDDGTLLWAYTPENLARLIRYCRQDMEVERQLHHLLARLNNNEQRIWWLDQTINDRGIGADLSLAAKAEHIATHAMKLLNQDMRAVSSGRVTTATSVAQIVRFCQSLGVDDIDSLRADRLEALLGRPDLPPQARRVLNIRAEASRVSVKKISALLTDSSPDGRVRGLLSYHVATTGRWAGRRFQPQNIKRPTNKDQDTLIKLVQTGSFDLVKRIGGSPLEVIGDIIRGLIVPAQGCQIYAADYANIEGRVLAWLAGEEWKLDSFRLYDAGIEEDMYRLSYARAFGVPVAAVDDNMRQLGKVMELALGYQGGVGAFQSMAHNYRVEVSNERAEQLKLAWRHAHPKTKQFWRALEDAAISAVRYAANKNNRGRQRFFFAGSRVEGSADRDVRKIRFHVQGSFLLMRLPSGRLLSYPYPEIRKVPWRNNTKDVPAIEDDDKAAMFENTGTPQLELESVDEILQQTRQGQQSQWGKDTLTFMSTINPSNAKRVLRDRYNKGNWARITTYGGSLAENATQAVARDIMAEGMLRVERNGYKVILTVHDEVVAEAPCDFGSVPEFQDLMVTLPAWATGLPVAAKAWKGGRYRKD